jgi:hypothetical protein
MLNVSRPNLFNTRPFFLQTVGVFAQIQTLVHQSFRLKSSNGESRSGSSGESHPPQTHSVLLFPNFISDSSSFPFLFLIGSSRRNFDSRRGPITILFPWAYGNLRPFRVHCSRQRIPFKAALSKPHEWQDAFKNWPLRPIAGWRNWYKRMLDDDSVKTSNWDNLRIAHCLELSLAETPKNENLLIAAYHFWSNGANAFLFGHGPMSPTLVDVYMITSLEVTGSVSHTSTKAPLGKQE